MHMYFGILHLDFFLGFIIILCYYNIISYRKKDFLDQRIFSIKDFHIALIVWDSVETFDLPGLMTGSDTLPVSRVRTLEYKRDIIHKQISVYWWDRIFCIVVEHARSHHVQSRADLLISWIYSLL